MPMGQSNKNARQEGIAMRICTSRVLLPPLTIIIHFTEAHWQDVNHLCA